MMTWACTAIGLIVYLCGHSGLPFLLVGVIVELARIERGISKVRIERRLTDKEWRRWKRMWVIATMAIVRGSGLTDEEREEWINGL